MKAVHFDQPDGGITLNRILDNNPSKIFGGLMANGTVFLINPHGIIFGGSQAIDVGSLIASTADVNDKFMKGFANSTGDIDLQLGKKSTGTVLNAKTINAKGGLVALHAAMVENTGNIEAEGGEIALSAARNVQLSLDTAGKLNFHVKADNVTNKALKEDIKSQGGYVLMTKADAEDLASTVINNGGFQEAKSIKFDENGDVRLEGCESGTVMATAGTLNTSGANGGIIKAVGDNVEVGSKAVLNASGSEQAGTIDLKARRNVTIDAPLTAEAGKFNVQLHADTDGVGKGMVVLNNNVDTNGGDFTSGTGQNITDGTVGTFFGNIKDTVREKKDITISTKGGNVNFYGDVGLGIENGTFTVDTTGGSGKGNINISGNLGSVNTYRFFQNGSSDGKGGNAVIDNDLKNLLEVYYNKYLKDVVWLKTTELSTKTITTPKGKTQTVYDWLKDRILGDESQYLGKKPANAAAEKKQ